MKKDLQAWNHLGKTTVRVDKLRDVQSFVSEHAKLDRRRSAGET